jgi:hypothetical protein
VIPVVLAGDHALHPNQHVDDGVPVIPSVLEDVGAMNLAIHPPSVLDEVIDFARNVPGGFALPIHPFVKVRRLPKPGGMQRRPNAAGLSPRAVS